jgi:hypothetical protein
MGKQSKRKRQKAKQHTPSLSAITASNSSNNNAKENPILSKIRHGDARVRHAALVALSRTVYDSTSLGRRSNNNNGISHNDPTLLRALSERLLDPDVPCAVIAAGCLSNYVSFGTTNTSSSSNDSKEAEEETLEISSQVMIPILIQRLSLGLDTLSSLLNNKLSSLSTDDARKKQCKDNGGAILSKQQQQQLRATIQEQWTLQSLSLQTLAGLIENCPLVVQRIGDAAVILPLLVKIIHCAVGFVEGDWNNGDNHDDDGDSSMDVVLEAATNSGRALHSLLDENIELIRQIPIGGDAEGYEWSVNTAVKELSDVIGNVKIGNNAARLHCCGAVLSLRKVLVDMEEDYGNTAVSNNASRGDAIIACQKMLQSCTMTLIVPTLHSFFSVIDKTSPKNMVHQMMELIETISSQKQDEAMESEVTSEINARKEPARLIARRQKEMKAKKQEDAEDKVDNNNKKAGDNVEMMEDDKKEGVVVMVEDYANKEIHQGEEVKMVDPQDELETIIKSWRNLVGSHKLALELVANLCSGPVEEEEEEEPGMYDHDDDDEHMWDSDDEAKLMETTGQSAIQKTASPADKEVYTSISSHKLVEQILIFFNHWVTFLPLLGLRVDEKCPSLVAKDVDELLATCAVCLGNMIACEIPTWTLPCAKEVVSVVCQGAAASVENGIGLVWWSLVANGKIDAMNHITTILLASLRHHSYVRSLADEPTLDMLLNLMMSQPGSNSSDQMDAKIQMDCNIIAMLGVLCTEPHPSSINSRVCSALTEKMRSASSTQTDNSPEACKQSVLILNEVYNVLMDMYGGDDANDEVYQQQDVSGNLNRTLPMFKRSIKKVLSMDRENEEMGIIWNETALNVSRFIRFKREG